MGTDQGPRGFVHNGVYTPGTLLSHIGPIVESLLLEGHGV